MKIKLCLLLLGMFIALSGCEVVQRIVGPRYYPLTVSSDKPTAVYNMNKYYILFRSGSETTKSTSLMAEAGDLLYITNNDIELFYRYEPRDGRTLSFTVDSDNPFKTYLNGRLINLDVSDDPDVWNWIEESDSRTLRHLRSLHLHFGEEPEQTRYTDHLRKLAAIRPGIGLYFSGYSPNSADICSLFMPSWLAFPEPMEFDEAAISKLKKLKSLLTYASEEAPIPGELPNLESLIVIADDEDVQLSGLPKLRSLTIFGCNSISGLSNSDFAKKLQRLFLISSDIDDISSLSAFHNLTGLGFVEYEGVVDLSKVQNLSRLRWFCFPPNVSQSDFELFLEQHPQLRVIDLLDCDELDDLSPLTGLAGLQGLTVDLSVEDISPLHQLENLDVLVLEEDFVDEEEYQQLQAALPETQITMGGYCLGSGWILFLIPLIIVGSLCIDLVRRRSPR